MFVIAIVIYAFAMTAANMSVAMFGPSITPINAFVFIGLDLALRDLLHTKISRLQMLSLIVATGFLTYVLNPAAGMIAIASAVSFTAAALVDWSIFARITGSWMRRSNASNVGGAAIDSLLFPTIAFGALMPQIVAMQFIAKVIGGAFWTWAIKKFVKE